ncbi:thiamine ABC transporter substrate binding subunit [Falsihalocynthiibacter arcticus]|uniref:Thiamine-binding periplasmic protein n=1 Tax=Falsihalocynthiibacter arcticus TaxID=1579316 RepID=A0A126UYY0_9RHOB|nr:thiamine ABC transporter substrate binding subunit [Falsihalocynthiibacter arcticus]AML51097.1 thiamine ABC transporter substrate-binding protein [Falsihalocynthiibacter arcticus]
MKYSMIAAGIVLASAATADTQELTVYTYDSFVSDWGPGPAIEKAFEAQCECDLKLVGAGDGAALLARVRLEGVRTKADIVLGLDTNLTAAAAETGLFALHGQEGVAFDLPIEWEDTMFIPYDWGYFAFIYDNTKISTPPANFKELAASDLKIVIQDPRSSTPGLGLLMWVKAAYGDEAPAIWEALSDNIITVTKGWSEAYGMFLEGEADMVLSYTTSPAYHLIAEEDASKSAAPFEEGHYLQVEVAAKVAHTDHSDLADEFLAFMVSDAFQSIIPTTNWMYPAVTPDDGLPEGFETLTIPTEALLFAAGDAQAERDGALEEWRLSLSK